MSEHGEVVDYDPRIRIPSGAYYELRAEVVWQRPVPRRLLVVRQGVLGPAPKVDREGEGMGASNYYKVHLELESDARPAVAIIADIAEAPAQTGAIMTGANWRDDRAGVEFQVYGDSADSAVFAVVKQVHDIFPDDPVDVVACSANVILNP